MNSVVRVLVVDDSAVVRQAFRKGLNARANIEVVGAARDAYEARDMVKQLEPDVITLDIEMPRMNGLSFLKRLMKFHPVPTIIVSSVAQKGCSIAVDCLQAGAFDVVPKPSERMKITEVIDSLAELIIAAKQVGVTKPKTTAAIQHDVPVVRPKISVPFSSGKIIVIGSSTGGTDALTKVLEHLPTDCPPILITQHMPGGFTTSFAHRLSQISRLNVKEAQDGDRIKPGNVLLADGNFHLKLARDDRGYVARVKDGPRVCRHKPSVEVLFESAVKAAGAQALGILLTGMGKDGAGGLLSLRNAGATTICQNEETCVVFGMAREAVILGAACHVTPLHQIPDQILNWACNSLEATKAA